MGGFSRMATLLAVAVAATPAVAAEPIKVGFLSTFSGPAGIIGDELANGFKLALSETGQTLGGRPVQMVYADDEAKPDIGRQIAGKMIESDHVQLMTGVIFSSVMLAVAKPVLDAGVFIVSDNAGPSQLAGKQCHPLLFVVSHQGDSLFEPVGIYMQKEKLDQVYILAPNYPAGRDVLNGFRRTFGGTISAEGYTPLNGLDYASTITDIKAKHPKSVMFFYPGGMGISFVKQYAQAGLVKEIPLYTGAGSVDQTTLPAIGDAAIGVHAIVNWSEDLDNPASKHFAASYTRSVGHLPSPYAAVSYDAARIVDAALKTIDGRIEDKAAFRHALETVKFDSVRGSFGFNTNHFPIQSFYSTVVEKGPDGKLAARMTGTVVRDYKDSYADQCKMPPG